MTPRAFLTVRTAESRLSAILYIKYAMQKLDDRETPDQLKEKRYDICNKRN